MRDTGPIRVRRDGDDSRVSSYLGLARKILGEVKQRAAAGGIATLYRALTLADGTWIRVGTVHGQDLVQIKPPQGEIEEFSSPAFAIRYPDDSDETARIAIRAPAKDEPAKRWSNKEGKADFPITDRPWHFNVIDWHESVVFKDGPRKRHSIEWMGPRTRYCNGGDTKGKWEESPSIPGYHVIVVDYTNERSDKIYLDGQDAWTAPYPVIGSCWTKRANDWYLRAACSSDATTIKFYEAQLDNNNQIGDWVLLGEKSLSTYFTGFSSSLTSKAYNLALWNGSGTQCLVPAAKAETYGRAQHSCIWILFTVSPVSVGGTIYSYPPKISWSIEQYEESGSLPNTRYQRSIYTVGEGGIIFDWDGDDIVSASLLLNGQGDYYVEQVDEVGVDNYWDGDFVRGYPIEWIHWDALTDWYGFPAAVFLPPVSLKINDKIVVDDFKSATRRVYKDNSSKTDVHQRIHTASHIDLRYGAFVIETSGWTFAMVGYDNNSTEYPDEIDYHAFPRSFDIDSNSTNQAPGSGRVFVDIAFLDEVISGKNKIPTSIESITSNVSQIYCTVSSPSEDYYGPVRYRLGNPLDWWNGYVEGEYIISPLDLFQPSWKNPAFYSSWPYTYSSYPYGGVSGKCSAACSPYGDLMAIGKPFLELETINDISIQRPFGAYTFSESFLYPPIDPVLEATFQRLPVDILNNGKASDRIKEAAEPEVYQVMGIGGSYTEREE